jgi:hypothetical protein
VFSKASDRSWSEGRKSSPERTDLGALRSCDVERRHEHLKS